MESSASSLSRANLGVRLAGVIEEARRRYRRRRRWAVLIALLTAMLAGWIANDGFSGGTPTPTAIGATGMAALELRPGQAVYTSAVNVDTIQWPSLEPAAGGGFLGSPKPTRGLVQYKANLGLWSAQNGAIRTKSHLASGPNFIGSAQARSAWNRDFQAHRQAWTNGLERSPLVGGQGFFLAGQRITYRQLLDLPTDPAILLRRIRAAATPSGADPIGVVDTLLTEVPLPARERAAVIRAAELLPGVRYLPSVRDPLGRAGAALATEGTEPPGPTSRWRLEVEYIFNPHTYAFLAEGSTLISPTSVQGVGTGFHLDWRAYISTKIVPQSTLPPLH